MAFITEATRKDAIALVVTTLGAAPSAEQLADITEKLVGGATMGDIAVHLTSSAAYLAKYPVGQTAKEVASDILDAALLGATVSAEARAEAMDLLTAGLTSGQYTIASATSAVADYLAGPSPAAAFADAAATFQNRVDAAEDFTKTFTLEGVAVTAAELAAALDGVTSNPLTLSSAKSAYAAGYKSATAKTAAEAEAAAEAAAAEAAAEAAAAAAAEAAAAEAAAAEAAAAAAAEAAAAEAAAAAAAAAAPKTFALTTASNTFTGGTGDDYFDASLNANGNQTIGSADTLTGGDGADILWAEVSGTGTYSPRLTGIETVQATFTGAGTLSMSKATGATNFELTNSSAASSITNLDSVDGLAISISNSDQNVTFGFDAAAIEGTSDSAAITLADVTAGTLTLPGIETLTIASTESANTLTALTAAKATSLTATGDQDLDLGTLSNKIATIDASAMTGALTATGTATANSITGGSGADSITGAAGNDTLTGGAGNDSITANAGVDTISGGAGDDTIVLAANLTAADTIDGGEGDDTLSITAAMTAAAPLVTGIETLSTSATAQDFSKFTGTTLTTVNSSGTAAAFTLSNTPNDLTLSITGAAPTNVTASKAVNSAADNLNVTIGRTAGAVTVADLIVVEQETLTINSTGAGTNTFTNIQNDDNTTLTLTGSKALTITSSDSTVLSTIDASAMTAAFVLSGNDSTTASTITGGSAGDTLAGSTKADTISGGAGGDTITGGGGNDTITGGAGNDDLTGGAGKDTISGGDGDDAIDGADGIDTLTGGAGNDTFTFDTDGDLTGGTALVTDNVDGGEGTDKVVVTTATAITPNLTSIEEVTATFTGAVALNMKNVTTLTKATVTTGSTAGASITGLADGTVVYVGDADFATIDYNAAASGTIVSTLDRSAALNISDVASVSLVASALGDDFSAIVLDNVDTTALTVTGGTAAAVDIDTGNITGTDKLETLTVTTSTAGATATLGTVVDLDSATTISLTADYGNIVVGALGGTGTAEVLANVNLTATNSANINVGNLTADTTNSTEENALTVTAASDSGSTITLGNVDNTQGALTLNLSGSGDVDAGTLTGDDVTLAFSAGDTSTLTAVTATDDVTITTSGSGKLTITTLNVGDDATITSTSSDTVTLTTIADGADDITIDASAATGAFIIGTNSNTGATAVLTATGGSGSDTLLGGSASDTISGGAGNDTIDGGAGNDTLTGGDGNDDITAGAGNDTISAGAGNDTITLDANLTANDTVDGGEGTDTVELTVNTTTGSIGGGSLTNVENLTLLFGTTTGGAYTGGGTVTTANVTATNNSTEVIMTNLPTGSTVNMSGADDVTTAYLDTVSGASLTVGLGDSQAGATADGDLTIVDAANVTLYAGTTAQTVAAGVYDDVVLDATDTTALTVKATSTLGLTVDDFSGSDKVATLTVSSASTGAVDMGTMADADSLTQLDITGVANVTTGVIGTDAASGDAAGLATINITGAGTGTVTVGNIFADTVATSATSVDGQQTVNVTANTGSTISAGTIDNEFGYTTLNVVGNGTVSALTMKADGAFAGITANVSGSGSTTITQLDAGTGDLVVNSSGAGAKIFSALDSTDDATMTFTGSGDVTITATTISDDATIDASALTGGFLTSDISGIAGTATVTGPDTVGFTSLKLAGTGASNAIVTLGVNGVTDQLVTGSTDAAGGIEVINFLKGASGDAIDLDVSGIEGLSGGTLDLISVDDSTASLGNTDTVVVDSVSAAFDAADLDAGTVILNVDGNFATAGLLETALEAGGSRAFTPDGAGAADDVILVTWDDGTNSYLSAVVTTAGFVDNTAPVAGDLTATTLITFTGVSDASTLTAANFGGALVA